MSKFEYNPCQIRISARRCAVSDLLDRLKEDRLAYNYDKSDFTTSWTNFIKSRLIESILIRLPISPFLIDATSNDCWVVAESSSQLSTLDEFITKESFSLTGLEYLGIEGLKFSELEPRYQRRIKETEVLVYLIDPGTPPAVKFNIIERLKLHG